MIAFEQHERWSLQEGLERLAHDPVGLSVLSRLDEESLPELAEAWCDEDLYRCGTIARDGLTAVLGHDPSEEQVVGAVEHVLWCAWRNAQWNTGRTASAPPSRFENSHHVDSTAGAPTVFISPMMLCMRDTLDLILRCVGERPLVLYGEGMAAKQQGWLGTPEHVRVVGDGSRHSVGVILKTLEEGGVFCTYPDFVFEGHAVAEGRLFGRARPYSKAFVSLCARRGVHLLPALARREEGGLVASLEEPVVFEFDARPDSKRLVERAILYSVQAMLEDLIGRKPEQWLLLGTLSAEVSRTMS